MALSVDGRLALPEVGVAELVAWTDDDATDVHELSGPALEFVAANVGRSG